MIGALIRTVWEHFKFWVLAVLGLAIAAVAMSLLAPVIVSMFGLGATAEAIAYGGVLLGVLALEGWLYDRYQLWRLFGLRPS